MGFSLPAFEVLKLTPIPGRLNATELNVQKYPGNCFMDRCVGTLWPTTWFHAGQGSIHKSVLI